MLVQSYMPALERLVGDIVIALATETAGTPFIGARNALGTSLQPAPEQSTRSLHLASANDLSAEACHGGLLQ